jgi:hypothetical protein
MGNSSYDQYQLDVTTMDLFLSIARIATDFLVEGNAPGYNAHRSKTRIPRGSRPYQI